MNPYALKRRIDKLSTKLGDEPKQRIGKFDSSSFTAEENILFQKIEQLQEQYGGCFPPDVLEEYSGLVDKGARVLMEYAVGTFKFTVLNLFGSDKPGFGKTCFDVFLYSFLVEVSQFLLEANKNQPLTEDAKVALLEKYDVVGKLARLANTKGTVPAGKKAGAE